jgi:preprotein translocase subunit SecG
MLHDVLMVVQLLAGICIVILVLLQHGQGADAGAGFGAGASGTVFGARGASTALSRATAIFAAIFMLNSIALTYLSTRAPEQQKSILDLAGQMHATRKAPPATSAPHNAPAPAQPSGPGAPPQK